MCVFCGDVLMAFDHLRPSEVCKAFTRHGVHPRLIAGLLREGRYLDIKLCFPNVVESEPARLSN